MKLTPDLATIIYYTSNQENEVFENNIRRKLLEVCGDLPIISVSQKPIDFGTNICVGDVGVNDDNLYRQIQMGCNAAKTPFVISAEADELYPPEYFDFIPPDMHEVYDYLNIWVLKEWQNHYYRKDKTEGARVVSREHYLKLLDVALKGLPEWNHTYSKDFKSVKEHCKMKLVIHPTHCQRFGTLEDTPVVSIKTSRGMRKYSSMVQGTSLASELPRWGTPANLLKELYEVA
jgi:hypothetical protein